MSELSISPGWATYLRVSDEDKQTPERSFSMQRKKIEDELLSPSKIRFTREYTDILSGTKVNRKDYQQMLTDAEAGKFSHLGLYRADRFGRNTVEGLQAATRLISLGIKIRIASMPSLQPENPDGFFMFLIQMGMAQREVDVLALRTRDGLEAKMLAGGWPHKAPEGYTNKERQVGSNKYERWVEADPPFNKAIKIAWELLLTDRYTLGEICEELAQQGFTRATGRPWAWDDPKTGNRKRAMGRLQYIFHLPFYAGWVVSEKFRIKMGDVRGNWEPVITTAEFERGLMILRKHDHNKSRKKRHNYLLRNVLWVQAGNKQFKMYGSTPSGRKETYSYYITHAKPNGSVVRKHTKDIDRQVSAWLQGIIIEPEHFPIIRAIYETQFDEVTKKDKEKEIRLLRGKLTGLKEEEARLGRLLITGKMSEDTYNQLRREWHEKVINLQIKIEELEIDSKKYLDNLEVALVLLANSSTLYERLKEKQKNELLQIITKRIIINEQGEIISHELNSPFAYLSTLAELISSESKEESGSEQIPSGASKTDSVFESVFLIQLITCIRIIIMR